MAEKIETTETTEENSTEKAAEPKAKSPEAETPKETTVTAAEYAKMKSALDKAAAEAADFKRQLRAMKTEEERRLEDEQERAAAKDKELEMLRRERSISIVAKSVSSFLGQDVDSDTIAESIYDAGSIEAAVDELMAEITKAWAAREKQLRLEYKRVDGPASGSDEPPAITKAEFDHMDYMERLEILKKFPALYDRLNV